VRVCTCVLEKRALRQNGRRDHVMVRVQDGSSNHVLTKSCVNQRSYNSNAHVLPVDFWSPCLCVHVCHHVKANNKNYTRIEEPCRAGCSSPSLDVQFTLMTYFQS